MRSLRYMLRKSRYAVFLTIFLKMESICMMGITWFRGIRILPGSAGLNPAKKTILLVSHDASRTGAPILALNMAQSLAARYNLVILLLGRGALVAAFQSAAVEVIVEPALRRLPTHYADYVISAICKRHAFLFALVNSVESRKVLPALASHYVPTVSVLHEFASVRPRNVFKEACGWSTETVFSTQLTLQDAVSTSGMRSDFSAHVIPQGKCIVPAGNISALALKKEQDRLSQCMRPGGRSDAHLVILGAGALELRKGVELFIACAAEVMRTEGGENCRFVWVGAGYDPEEDMDYSAYLADQIQRAGLEKHMIFAGETAQIEWAYSLADIFLLSSRLDPLPNVAIDAMYHGLPVLCFDKTTGIADFLKENALGELCVADYLDTYGLSKKIMALVHSAPLRKTTGAQCKAAAIATFDMEDYVARLEALALSAQDKIQQDKADMQEILSSGRFQSRFSFPRRSIFALSDEEGIKRYFWNWKTGIAPRKPFSGFHPGIYRAAHGLARKGADPLADYLRQGEPQGPWRFPVISPISDLHPVDMEEKRIALHLHVYYPDLLPEILQRLLCNTVRPDLFISVRDTVAQEKVKRALIGYTGTIAEIQVMPNQGRDIGSLLTGFGKTLAENYDIVGHLHTKKSIHVVSQRLISRWKNFLLENLLGGEKGGRMADSILTTMLHDPSISMVFPDDPHAMGWTENRPAAEKLAPRLGLSSLPEAFNFPIGTMFWMRTPLLKRFVDLDLSWEDYPPEPLPTDGSMLHGLERLFGVVATSDPFRLAVTYIPGVGR
jgi:glycosyltransferase involved in cell wall biosynthesis